MLHYSFQEIEFDPFGFGPGVYLVIVNTDFHSSSSSHCVSLCGQARGEEGVGRGKEEGRRRKELPVFKRTPYEG